MGWPTKTLVAFDELAPNLIRQVLRFSNGRRHAVFAAIGFRVTNDSGDRAERLPVDEAHDQKVAKLLRDGSASDIIAGVYGFVPDGFLGALERCGNKPLQPKHYARLFVIFASDCRKNALALRHIPEITDQTIQILDDLLPVLVDGKILSRLEDRRAARDLNKSILLCKKICSKATDAAIEAAIRNLEPHSNLQRLIGRFMNRADIFPPQPFEGDDELAPLKSAPALIWAGRRYRNCLPRLVGRAISGQLAFAEFRGDLILEFHPLSDGRWILAETHSAMNGPVDQAADEEAKRKCASIGIAYVARANKSSDDWNALARVAGRWDWALRG